MNILYAEDESWTRRMVKKIIENENHIVYEASNGIIGLKKFLEVKPDLIITDLSMPEMDGFEMIANIRKYNDTVPIIVTTAYREEAEKIISSVTQCIYKPILKNDLLNAIKSIHQQTIF